MTIRTHQNSGVKPATTILDAAEGFSLCVLTKGSTSYLSDPIIGWRVERGERYEPVTPITPFGSLPDMPRTRVVAIRYRDLFYSTEWAGGIPEGMAILALNSVGASS